MNNKIIYLTILCMNFLIIYAIVCADEPIKVLYNNRDHIINILNNLSDGSEIGNDLHKYGFMSYVKIFRYRDSSFVYWKLNEKSFLDDFIGCENEIKKYKQYRYYIDDSITVSILSSLLDYPDPRTKPEDNDTYFKIRCGLLKDYGESKERNWSREALHILTYGVYFSALRKHSDKINFHLKNCKELELEKLKLFVLLNQPDTILKHKRDSLVVRKRHLDSLQKVLEKDTNIITNKQKQDSLRMVMCELTMLKYIPLWVMARLGDHKAELAIVRALNRREVGGIDYLSFAIDASFVWSDSCKMAFLNLFNRDMPSCPPLFDEEGKLCFSLQDTLLVLLARHHPTEPIFSNLLSSNRINADYCKLETQTPYFKKFSEWVKSIYGIEITYPGFTPYFRKIRKDLSTDKSAIRDYCK